MPNAITITTLQLPLTPIIQILAWKKINNLLNTYMLYTRETANGGRECITEANHVQCADMTHVPESEVAYPFRDDEPVTTYVCTRQDLLSFESWYV